MRGDRDPALRRFERDSVVACLAMAVLSFPVVAVGRGFTPALNVALGVVGGGLLMALSYRAIKGAADVVMNTPRAVIRPEVPGSEAGAHRSEQDVPGGGAQEHRSEQDPGSAAQDHRSEQDVPGSAAQDHRSEQDLRPAPGRAFLAVKFFTRYALLAIAAYVMLTCLRLHPAGLLVGVSSPFVAAVVEVGRLSRARRPHS